MNTRRDVTTGRFLKTHGMRNHPLYYVWRNMILRCDDRKRWDYKYYGGKGVKVFTDWYHVETFIEWCESNGWSEGLTIDRINRDDDYSPDNCRFVTQTQQARTSSQAKINLNIARSIRDNCSSRTYAEYVRLAQEYGISIHTVKLIIYGKLWKEIDE